jgi:predicted polyphosphate/ATP-dependent NAD kinase
MLVEGLPDLVVAFPGGSGTANMIAQAKRAHVPCIQIFGGTPP